MAVRKGSEFRIGPLTPYICDGIGIKQAGKSHGNYTYQIVAYESKTAYDPSILETRYHNGFEDRRGEEDVVGNKTIIYMTDDDLEEFFLAWQILKTEREKK